MPLTQPLQPQVRACQLRRKRLHESDSDGVDGVGGLEAQGPEACRAAFGLQEELPWPGTTAGMWEPVPPLGSRVEGSLQGA